MNLGPTYNLMTAYTSFIAVSEVVRNSGDSEDVDHGLGLNIVKEIALLHNGDVRLESRSEKGARATLSLSLTASS